MDIPLYERLLAAAIRFVSFRPRSEKEFIVFLRGKLTRWHVAGEESVRRVLQRLRELEYLNDHKFAQWWVDQRDSFKPRGERAVRLELIRKGITREIADEVLKKGDRGFSELGLARKAISKKLVLWAKLPIIEQKKKVYTFLAQRGFSAEVSASIIDEISKKRYNVPSDDIESSKN